MLTTMKSLRNWLACIFNAHLALLIYPFSGRRERQWVIGGVRGELFSDNSKAFYQYMVREHPEISIRWIAREGSPAAEIIGESAIIKGSIESYLSFYNSEVVVFSDTLNQDIAPGIYAMPLLRYFYNRILKVRLNHGTISFKKKLQTTGITGTIKQQVLRSYDLYIAATPLEVKAMQQYAAKNSIVLAGSARNDCVKQTSTQSKVILIAPTWRTWLVGESNFRSTEFYLNYCGLLSDPTLHATLREKGVTIEFYLHHMMHEHRKHFDYLENDVVKIVDSGFDISKTIISSALMVTDYSSICSERYLLNKPVLFFQFDQERYSNEIGSYIDLKNDVFGVVTKEVSEVVAKIFNTIEQSYPVHKRQRAGDSYFVYFRDQNNCDRIFFAIDERLSDHTTVQTIHQ